MKVEVKQTNSPSNILSANSNRMGVTVNEKLFGMMSDNIYKNIPNAIVRELTSNAIDASVISGTKEPVVVHIPQNLGQDFYIQDFGAGMSIETMIHVFANYFSSTKENDETQIGGFGLGSKTPFAYVEEAGFRVETTSPDDGVRRTFAFKRVQDELGDKYPHYQHLDDLDIKESSIKGTKISFALKNENDIKNFALACLPMLYSIHPIDFTGYNILSFVKFQTNKHHKLLQELKETGMILLDSNESSYVHFNFNFSDLYLKDEHLLSLRQFNFGDLSDVLNLRLGSVIYQHKLKSSKSSGSKMNHLWHFMNKMLIAIEKRVLMLDVQENGHIALDVARESIRETELNKQNLFNLLKEKGLLIADIVVQSIEKDLLKMQEFMEKKSFHEYFAKNKVCMRKIESLSEFIDFMDEFQQLDDLKEKVNHLNQKVIEIENAWAEKFNNVFAVDFEDNKYVKGDLLFKSLMKNKGNSFIFVEKNMWETIKKDEMLKKSFFQNYKKFKFITFGEDVAHWVDIVKNFHNLEKSKLTEIQKTIQKEIKEQHERKTKLNLNYSLMKEGNQFALVDVKADGSNYLTMPINYSIDNLNKLKNTDKAMFMLYDFFGQIFNCYLKDEMNEKEMSEETKAEFQKINHFNQEVLKLFDDKSRLISLLKNKNKEIKFINPSHYPIYKQPKPYEILLGFYRLIARLKSDYEQSYDKYYEYSFKPLEVEDYSKNIPRNMNDRQIKEYLISIINERTKEIEKTEVEKTNPNVIKCLVFGSEADSKRNNYKMIDEKILNYFDKKHDLIKFAKTIMFIEEPSFINELIEKLDNNLDFYEKTGLDNYFTMNNKLNFAFYNEEEFEAKQKSLFGILFKINHLMSSVETARSEKDLNFDVQDVPFDLKWEYVDELKDKLKQYNNKLKSKEKDNKLIPLVKKMFDEEIPDISVPKNKILALYLKIAQELDNKVN